ncbi:helix-turn-helix transcriptional regulator [Actinoplanes sp. NPDC048791]|uniref:helix-turn-helix domain-containing protein n=1 Tax=Actinoplanes sp. NPDC048791 TaxID=3154623 RepID=UPI0033D8C7D0
MDEIPPRHDEDVPFAVGSIARIGLMFRALSPFYELVHITGGAGAQVVNRDEQELHPPQMCVSTPGQTGHWRQVPRLPGHVVIFTDDFLLTHPGDRDALHRLARTPGRQLSPEESGRIQHLIAEMEREHRQREPGFRGVLQAYLHVLIVETGRAHRPRLDARATAPADTLAQRFQELLADPELLGAGVPAYATRLGVSTSYLNDKVHQAMGATPGHIIRQARASQAKRLLADTALPVAQVAVRLGFADAAYFCRFFRREAGDTPGGFRRRARAQDRSSS